MLPTPELELLLNILRYDANKTDFVPNKDPAINWDHLLQLIIRHRVTPQVFYQIDNLHNVPIKFIADLRQLNYKIKMQNLNALGEIIRITKGLTENNIPYIIVKGIPLAQLVYKDTYIRQAKDIDLLVDITNLDEAQNLIIKLGYTTIRPTYPLTNFKESYYLLHRHDIALYNQQRSVEVELHFNLNYLGIPFFKLADIPTKTLTINNNTIYIPNNEYDLLYLMLHAAIHAYSRLRWLHDIVLFLENTDIDINKVFALSKTLHIEHIVIQALLLIKKLYRTDNTAINFLIEQNSNKQAVYLAKTAEKFIFANYELSDNNKAYDKMFILYRFYLLRLACKGQKLQALFGDLFKIDTIFPYVTMPKHLSSGYYILYPIMVIKYLIFRKF